MTEEKIGRDKIQQPGQPNENLANHQTSKNRFKQLLASKFSFPAKENKTMTNEENRPNATPQQTAPSPPPGDPENAAGDPDTPEKRAVEQFEEIKQALIGDNPEWLIPRVDSRALASEP